NNAGLAYSNFDVRDRIISSINYKTSYGAHKTYQTTVSLFISASSGVPFTYGFVNTPINIQNTGQQVNLAYIPTASQMINFFQTGNILLSNNTVVYKTQVNTDKPSIQIIVSVPYQTRG